MEGSSWWEKILYSIRPDYINESGFSEFETYGNYVMKYHFGEYSLRSISQYRTVNAFISMNPSARQLDWAFESFDSITFEDWPGITFLGISKLLMKLHISLKTITSVVDFLQ